MNSPVFERNADMKNTEFWQYLRIDLEALKICF